MKYKCVLCTKWSTDKLCRTHRKEYIWDSSIEGYRIKKRLRGSRYTTRKYHKKEISLTKILESFYGRENIVTSYRPLWAVSKKLVLYEFDIYIKNKKVLIEYNSKIHYEYTPFFHKTRSDFTDQIARDKHKKELAKEKGICLVIFTEDDPLFKGSVIAKIENESTLFYRT